MTIVSGTACRVGGRRLARRRVRQLGYRGQGHDTTILQVMIDVAHAEKRSIAAEIWADNVASTALHERQGFVLTSTQEKSGRELRTYSLSDRS